MLQYSTLCGFLSINIIKKEKERDRGICRKENLNSKEKKYQIFCIYSINSLNNTNKKRVSKHACKMVLKNPKVMNCLI